MYTRRQSMPSYLELSKLALIGNDHGQIFERLIPHYSRLVAKHEVLRESLLSRFQPSVNLSRWNIF